jgi:hypothetical protein
MSSSKILRVKTKLMYRKYSSLITHSERTNITNLFITLLPQIIRQVAPDSVKKCQIIHIIIEQLSNYHAHTVNTTTEIWMD